MSFIQTVIAVLAFLGGCAAVATAVWYAGWSTLEWVERRVAKGSRPSDPFGYRLAIAEAIAAGDTHVAAPAIAVLNYARCLMHAVPVDSGLRAKVLDLWPRAVAGLLGQLLQWTDSAETLDSRWGLAGPLEADELVRDLVELRTDAEGVREVIRKLPAGSFRSDQVLIEAAIARFDAALRRQVGILATQADSDWLANFSGDIPSAAKYWWLTGLRGVPLS